MRILNSLFTAASIALAVITVSCQSSSPAASKLPATEKKINPYWTELTQVPAGLPEHAAPLPEVYRLLKLNLPALREHLAAKGKNEGMSKEFIVPVADGTQLTYLVTESANVPKQVTDKNPGLKAYTGKRKDDQTSNIRLELSHNGLQATLSHPTNVAVIEPYAKGDTVHYISYYKSRRSVRHPNLRDMKNTKPAEIPQPNK